MPAPSVVPLPAPTPTAPPPRTTARTPAPKSSAKPVAKLTGKSAGPPSGKPAKPSTPRPRAEPIAPPLPDAPASGSIVRLSRVLNVPASAIFRAVNDPERRGWAPESLFRIMTVLAPRFIRLAFPDGTNVAISVARQGNARALVALEITKLPAGADERDVKQRWNHALSALQEQLDTSWD